MNAKRIVKVFEANTARKAIGGLLIHGTEWLMLVGVLVLLTADVWLGAQVFMSKGMDKWTSYLVAMATSAVQVALFAKGGELIGKATGKWKMLVAWAALVIGWLVALLDSFLDGLAALVKLGGGIPSTWREIGIMLGDPVILVAFIMFFVLSLFGERLARLVIFGEFEVARQPVANPEPVVTTMLSVAPKDEPTSILDMLRREHPAEPRTFQASA